MLPRGSGVRNGRGETSRAWYLLAIVLSTAFSRSGASEPQSSVSQEPLPKNQPFRFGVGVDAVTLDVVVTDGKSRFVEGLKKDDFIVLENGVPQELTFFTSVVTPVTVLVLLDGSSSVRSSLEAIQKAASRFVRKLRPGDQARVGYFHERVIFGPRFTDETKEHLAIIRMILPYGSTLLYDAVLASLRELSAIPDRKALLVLTDGDDAGSVAKEQEVFEAVRRSDIAIYTVGFQGWSPRKGGDINKDLLTRLARETGGRAFFPPNDAEMVKSFDQIQDELHRQYRMAYTPPESPEGVAWRRIEVRTLRRKDLNVRTRVGYYGRARGSR